MKFAPPVEISARIAPSLDNLRLGARLVSMICFECECDDEYASMLDLAVSESLTNAVKYAGDSDSMIELLVLITHDKLILEITDSGPGFDFHAVKEPDFQNLSAGGYGIYLIKQVMDVVEYRQKNGTNTLHLERSLQRK